MGEGGDEQEDDPPLPTIQEDLDDEGEDPVRPRGDQDADYDPELDEMIEEAARGGRKVRRSSGVPKRDSNRDT